MNKKTVRVELTEHEARMLMYAVGERLKHLTHALAAGAVTGPELEKRIDRWRVVLGKLVAAVTGP